MTVLSKTIRAGLFASLVISGGMTIPARAAIIDLGFALDASGSVPQATFNNAADALAAALVQIPVGGPDTYRISVVTFASSSSTVVTRTISTAADLTFVQNAVSNANYTGGSTCISCATTLLTNNFNALGGLGNFSLINISTDGAPNVGEENGTTLRNSLTAAGWDGVSAEAIGNFSLTFLQNLVYPRPPVVTNNVALLPDPFAQGFILTLTSFDGYAAAIDAKVRNIVVNPPEVPIPGALPLFASVLGLGGLVRYRRNRKAQLAAA